MANPCVYTYIRTKCCDLDGHGFGRWWWFTLTCLMLVLPCTFARSSDEETVFIYPEGDIYIRYGHDLEMFCTAGAGSTAEDLVFTLSAKPLESEIINSTTIRLFTEKPPEHTRQTYYCNNRRTDRNALKSVVVGSSPAKVKDFGCISKNLDMLNCSWTTQDLIIFTNYNLTYYFHGNPVKPCVASPVDDSLTRYCTFATNSTPPYRQQEDVFQFYLVSDNVFGRNKENFTIDHYSVVKPDPPMNLQNISESPHSVVLQWSIPNNIVDFLDGGVEHKIEYQIAKIDDTSYFRRVNTSILPTNNKTYRFNLTDLPYAHMQYGIRVYIRPVRAKSDKFWSDFNNLVFYTTSERPRRPPDMAAGAFRQNPFQNYRVVYVYWKQLEEFEEAGANFTYKIVVKQGSNIQTLFPDKNKSLGFLVLDGASLDAMDIYVWSFNEIGSSVNSSHLYIPPESETRSLDLTSFTKLAYENGTYELSWFGIDNIDNYTLFWCQHNTTDICNGRIDFIILDPSKDKHVINLPRDYRYQFAISANKGARTSGMIWARCDISKDEISMYRFPIVFTDHDAPGKSFVELRWSMDCILEDGIIIGYNISYCPVIKTSSVCDKSVKNQSTYINNSKQMYTTIENLEPYKTYQFSMALNTIYGLKQIENTTVRITTLEDTPTSPRNVHIFDIKNDSFVMSWDRPEHLNGHVSKIKYVIYNFGKKLHEVRYDDKLSNELRIQITLDKLHGFTIHGFTNYSLSVQACNEGIASCSAPTNAISLRNRIGSPSKLNIPVVNESLDVLTWEPPEIFGGTVDQYQIRIIKGNQSEIINTTNLSYPITRCQGAVKSEKYQVRAVNFDVDLNHGAASDSDNVTLPKRYEEDVEMLTYPSDWSDVATVYCTGGNTLFLIFVLVGLLFVVAAGCGFLKLYRKIRKMKDIKPEFPKGLFIAPEKDPKYPFSGMYPAGKDEKPTSDEMLLLPNSKTSVSTPETKQNDNCGSSDHTDSTALSDTSQGPIDRQNSTSDEDSHSSLRLEVEPIKAENDNNAIQEEESSNSDTGSSSENSPYFSDNAFKKNKVTGYVQPVVNPMTGYIQSSPLPFKNSLQNTAMQPATSSYVMAGLPPPLFTGGISPHNQPPTGYVRPEDPIVRPPMNVPKLGPLPTKIFGSESLPTMPTLPPPNKYGADSSYIQLQSLDALPSQKPTVRNSMPLKPTTASSGYVSPEDAILNKHLKNMKSGGQLAEESAILDPAMSPYAYCRFSWSADPANDNLHSLLGNPATINPSKN